MIHRELHNMEKIGRAYSQYNMYRITCITLAWVFAVVTLFLIGCEESSSSPSSVARKITTSLATAPAEVTNIQTGVTSTGMRVSWTAPSLSASHKTNKGDTLTVAQVSYKVYSIAKSGSIQRTVAQIKTADKSPKTVTAGTTNITLTGLINGTTYEIVVQAVNSTDTTKASTGLRYEFQAQRSSKQAKSTVSIGNTTEVSAEVGKTPAINSTRVLSSNSDFTCDANILEADSKKIKEETGLIVSFEQSSKTVSVTGIANKSNVHDPAITSYSYDVVQCTITASSKKVKASIIIRTGLRAAPSGEITTYYRPTTKKALQEIIEAEEEVGRQNTYSPNLNMVDTSAITDMSALFRDNGPFNGDITQWNTSNVSNMESMFDGASDFNQNIGSWDVSNVEIMAHMFRGTSISDFNQDIGNWDVSKVTSMYHMFDKATAFNQDIGNWNVSKVTNMAYMFRGASSFNQNIGKWNVNNIIHFVYAFTDASVFDQNLSSWKLCKTRLQSNAEDFKGSAMESKTAKHPKDSTDTTACASS